MAAHSTPEQGDPTVTRVDPSTQDDPSYADTAVPPGNAGPDCFWLPVGSPLPSPRIAEVHSLDQQPKPLRPLPAT